MNQKSEDTAEMFPAWIGKYKGAVQIALSTGMSDQLLCCEAWLWYVFDSQGSAVPRIFNLVA